MHLSLCMLLSLPLEKFSKIYNKFLPYVDGDFCLASDKYCISFSSAGIVNVEKGFFVVVVVYHASSSYAAAVEI